MQKVALITGASRGIGRSTAIEFAARGWHVALAARGEDELIRTSHGIKDSLPLVADVSDPAQASNLIDKTLAHFSRLDCLVNNAGLAPIKSITDTSLEEWKAILETNLSSAFYTTKQAWPHLQKSSGCIVNITSPAARDPFPGLGFYGVAKAGLNTFSLALAREGEPHGIRVYAIAPGMTETAMFRGLFNESQVSRDLTLDPDDVAKTIVDCATGHLKLSSGDILYLKQSPIRSREQGLG